ncbi:hypothetical protein F2Q69_00030575 [Brassica cretica]|uniref:Uncharacterized protein n=1 Tax=Brassica cretica TaxID=69181 RepID=A0A8S9RZ85_BRACR|nr:hypothetical protein F2Q69_00030575 [Brassica cretica]
MMTPHHSDQQLVGFLLEGGNPLGLVGDDQIWKLDLESQTDPVWPDILWEASSVSGLKQCCLECLVNLTVGSSLIELKFGRGVVDLFILDLYGGIGLWLPES